MVSWNLVPSTTASRGWEGDVRVGCSLRNALDGEIGYEVAPGATAKDKLGRSLRIGAAASIREEHSSPSISPQADVDRHAPRSGVGGQIALSLEHDLTADGSDIVGAGAVEIDISEAFSLCGGRISDVTDGVVGWTWGLGARVRIGRFLNAYVDFASVPWASSSGRRVTVLEFRVGGRKHGDRSQAGSVPSP